MKRYVARIELCTAGLHPVLRAKKATSHHFTDAFEDWIQLHPSWIKKKRVRLFFYPTQVKGALPITIRLPIHRGSVRNWGSIHVGEMCAYDSAPCLRWRKFFEYWKWVRFE